MKRVLFLAGALLLLGCLQSGEPTVTATPSPTVENLQSANPAAVHCTRLGYQLQVVDGAQGQSGACVFPDGSTCDDFAFLRGECGQSFSACVKAGGKFGAVFMGPDGAVTDNSSCQFPDGSFCEELVLALGYCRPGQQFA